jgi:DNA-binding NarL/FixJ family response regulator
LLFACRRYDEAFQVLIDSETLPGLLQALEAFSKHISDTSVKQRIMSAIEHLTPAELGLGVLVFETEYWSWFGSTQKSRYCAEEILGRANAESAHILCALHSIYRLASTQTKAEHELLFERLPGIIRRLSDADRTQAQAYQAALLARYPESAQEARELIGVVRRGIDTLAPRARIDTQIAIATALYYFGDDEGALRANRDALGGAQSLDDPRELARTLSNYGLMLYHIFDPAVEAIFEPLRHTVEKSGSWRFSVVSHWLPAQFYALQGNVTKALAVRALQLQVAASDEQSKGQLTFLRRHSMNLCRLLSADFAEIILDFRNAPLPRETDSTYELLIDVAAAYAFRSDISEAAKMLMQAKATRESLSTLAFKSVRAAIILEIVVLSELGRWSEARRLHRQIAGTAQNLASLDEALSRFCDGPPFIEVQALMQFCFDQPYMGLPTVLMQRVMDRAKGAEKPSLTPAEMEVLRLLALGKSNKEIAAARSRSVETVKRQVASLYQKLGVESRTGAAAVARSRGLL